MRKTKNTPKFKTEAEERAFWENNDSSEYVTGNKPNEFLCPT
jgi:hypothetical protein